MIHKSEAVLLAFMLLGGALLMGYVGMTGDYPWKASMSHESSCPQQAPKHD